MAPFLCHKQKEGNRIGTYSKQTTILRSELKKNTDIFCLDWHITTSISIFLFCKGFSRYTLIPFTDTIGVLGLFLTGFHLQPDVSYGRSLNRTSLNLQTGSFFRQTVQITVLTATTNNLK